MRFERGKKRSGSVKRLTAEFFAAADPQVSFDGSKILFSAQRERAMRWQIWEMNADGSAKQQVTECPGDCLRPVYLPREMIAYTVVAKRGGHPISQVYVAQRDGAEPRPITFGPGDFHLETVLRDGRLLISASSPLLEGSAAAGGRELYAVRIDGTALAAFRCDHEQPSIRAQATELDDGTVVYVKNDPKQDGAGGGLAQIRRGALHNSTLSPQRAVYSSPRPLKSHTLIVSREDPSPRGKGRFDLYAFDSANGESGELIFKDRKLSSVQAIPLSASPAPRWFWSIVKPELKVGYFICLNSYLSSEAPGGRITTRIANVRVLTLDQDAQEERTLGEAPVEEDGSFYVAVPPDRPMRFELLDAHGRVISAQRSWIWTRPGEEAACVGCHENRAIAPPNRWPQTLRRLDTPIHLGVEGAPQAAH